MSSLCLTSTTCPALPISELTIQFTSQPPERWKHSMDFVHNIDYARGADGGLCGVDIFIHPMMAHLTVLIRHLEQAGKFRPCFNPDSRAA